MQSWLIALEAVRMRNITRALKWSDLRIELKIKGHIQMFYVLNDSSTLFEMFLF